MKAIITKIEWQKEYETQYGLLNLFKVTYDEKVGYYSSKKKEQTTFTEGKEAEFTEEKRTGKNGEFLVIKPMKLAQPMSNFGRQLKKEQSRYSGFALSYAKDLVVSGRIQMSEIFPKALEMFDFMVMLDKTLES